MQRGMLLSVTFYLFFVFGTLGLPRMSGQFSLTPPLPPLV